MKRIIAAVLTVLCLLPVLTACKTEEQLGISYDPIVCRFSVGGGFGNIYDTMGYDITVYADNHIEVHSGTMEYYSGLGFSEYSVDVPITEEFYALLRPGCRVVYAAEKPDLQEATEYLINHKPKLTLSQLRAEAGAM